MVIFLNKFLSSGGKNGGRSKQSPILPMINNGVLSFAGYAQPHFDWNNLYRKANAAG